MIAIAASTVFVFAAFAIGFVLGHRHRRDELAEDLRTQIAAQRLREHHRVNAEYKAYQKISLRPKPILDGEVMKVSMN